MRKPILLLLILLPLAATAEVYRYVDKNGVVHYTDKAPDKNAKPVSLPPLQTYPAGDAPSSAPSAAPARQAEYKVSITSPSQDETFRDPGAAIAVSAAVTPALIDGYGLVFYVDGAPASGGPSEATSFVLNGLERGQHLLSAALVDPQGKEVARSASVTIHLLLPSVGR